jgi:hypothetical protein
MIAGLEEISDGEVLIGGKVVNPLTPRERNIAMVFQSYALYPHMTVKENMGFSLKIAGRPQDEIEERVAEAAQILDLNHLLERRPSQLSGARGSAWPWGGPSCATRMCSCSTNRSAISTPSCGPRCGPRSRSCMPR